MDAIKRPCHLPRPNSLRHGSYQIGRTPHSARGAGAARPTPPQNSRSWSCPCTPYRAVGSPGTGKTTLARGWPIRWRMH